MQGWGPFLNRDSSTCIFPAKLDKFLRAPSVKSICKPLLLYLQVILFTIHVKDTANPRVIRIFSNIYDEVFLAKTVNEFYLDTSIIDTYLVHCHHYHNIRAKLLNSLEVLDTNLLKISEEQLTKVLLYGFSQLDQNQNRNYWILQSTK